MNPQPMLRFLAFLLATAISLTAANAATEVRVSETGPQIYRLPMYVAMLNGYFAEEGLTVKTVQVRSTADATKMLIGGAAEFQCGVPADILNARKQGIDVKAYAMLHEHLNNSIVIQKSKAAEIKDFKDLSTRPIGISGVGGGNWQVVVLMAKLMNIDPEKINMISLGPDTAVSAFKAGKVDGLAFTDPEISGLIDAGEALPLVDFADIDTHRRLIGERILFTDIMTTTDYAKANPEVMQSFLNGIQKGIAWTKGKSAEELAALLQRMDHFKQFDSKLLAKAMSRIMVGIPQSAVVTEDSIVNFNRLMQRIGLTEKPVPFEEFVDNSFAVKAAEKYPK